MTDKVEYVDVPLRKWVRSDLVSEVERLRAFIHRTAREHCHCDLEPDVCSVCRARAEVVANG